MARTKQRPVNLPGVKHLGSS
nr:unnamed protein product [Callosobruchus chinensis]